jgi:hypothetical protein
MRPSTGKSQPHPLNANLLAGNPGSPKAQRHGQSFIAPEKSFCQQ